MPRASVPPKLEQWGAQALGALPPRLQVRLSGKPPVQIDGDTLGARDAASPGGARPPARAAARDPARRPRRGRRARRLTAAYAGRPVARRHGPGRRDRRAGSRSEPATTHRPSPAARTRCSSTTTAAASPTATSTRTTAPAASSAATPARTCSRSTTASRPSIRFPAAVDDARAALRWAHANAAELGADPSRVAVGGDSAGGNLAAVVSQLAARDGGPAPVAPAADLPGHRRHRPGAARASCSREGFLLTDAEMDWFDGPLPRPAAPTPAIRARRRCSPRTCPASPPALVVTAGVRPAARRGRGLRAGARAAGTPATLRRFPGFIHGFINAAGVSRTARDALVEIAGVTRGMFEWCGAD